MECSCSNRAKCLLFETVPQNDYRGFFGCQPSPPQCPRCARNHRQYRASDPGFRRRSSAQPANAIPSIATAIVRHRLHLRQSSKLPTYRSLKACVTRLSAPASRHRFANYAGSNVFMPTRMATRIAAAIMLYSNAERLLRRSSINRRGASIAFPPFPVRPHRRSPLSRGGLSRRYAGLGTQDSLPCAAERPDALHLVL
jgi:hypothetical protein